MIEPTEEWPKTETVTKQQSQASLAAPSGSVNCPRELFEWLTEYAIDLRGEYSWRRNSTPRNNEIMDKLDAHIMEACALRDSPNSVLDEPKRIEASHQ